MGRLIVINKTDQQSIELGSLSFVNSKNHKLLLNIEEILNVLKSGVVSCSFLEGWNSKHLKYLGVTENLIASQPNLCSLVPTSATTGRPKLCVYSASTLGNISNVDYAQDFCDRRIYSSLSLSHSYMYPGTILPALRTSEFIVLDRSENPFNFKKIIEQYEIDFVVSVPAQLKLWSKLNTQLLSVQKIYSAGGPFPYDSLNSLKRVFPNAQFINNYGATECGPRIGNSLIKNQELENRFDLLDDVTLKTVDGRAIYLSPRMMYNYLGKFHKIEQFTLNDKITKSRRSIVLHGRSDNVLNLGGKKVSYEHVKAIIKSMKGVKHFFFSDEMLQINLVLDSPDYGETYISELSEALLIEKSYLNYTTQDIPKNYK